MHVLEPPGFPMLCLFCPHHQPSPSHHSLTPTFWTPSFMPVGPASAFALPVAACGGHQGRCQANHTNKALVFQGSWSFESSLPSHSLSEGCVPVSLRRAACRHFPSDAELASWPSSLPGDTQAAGTPLAPGWGWLFQGVSGELLPAGVRCNHGVDPTSPGSWEPPPQLSQHLTVHEIHNTRLGVGEC